jgi:hypothetical protein
VSLAERLDEQTLHRPKIPLGASPNEECAHSSVLMALKPNFVGQVTFESRRGEVF